MILTFTPNPCVDKTVFIDDLLVGASMRSKRYTCIPGGKGVNVSRAVHALDRPTKALVVVGGFTGQHVVDMIEKQDAVACAPVWVPSPTRTITTVLETNVHRQTVFFEPGSEITSEDLTTIVSAFRQHVAGASVVTFSGAVSHPNAAGLYREMIPIAREAGALAILDSYGPEFAAALPTAPYMVKPNVKELEIWAGTELPDTTSRWEAIEKLHRAGVSLVVLSLGKDGIMVSQMLAGKQEQFTATPPEIEEVNAVGSGDCLVAGFAIGLAERKPLEYAARQGVAMGTANAMTWDIGHFDVDQIASLMERVTVRYRR